MATPESHQAYMLGLDTSVTSDFDFQLFSEHSTSHITSPPQMNYNAMMQYYPDDMSTFPRQLQDPYQVCSTFDDYAGFQAFHAAAHSSPQNYAAASPDFRVPPSSHSTVSEASAPSSVTGSPYVYHHHGVAGSMPSLIINHSNINPGIVGYDGFGAQEYTFNSGMENDLVLTDLKSPFVDPSMMHGLVAPPMSRRMDIAFHTASLHPPPSPSPSQLSSRSSQGVKRSRDGQSPYAHSLAQPMQQRRPSLVSRHSQSSVDGAYSSDGEKGRCPVQDCGKSFKDLKAHMLTHQMERPEKCPITTCDYHVKGFARKYDKNRHTLTHYKGTMVCGFCPGSGSSAEKSFNRADVFKRHLTTVHDVEQTPPNSRKKASNATTPAKSLASYGPDATGKCSTCSTRFNNAQEFYEHLDDCVLRIVQQEDPTESVNAQRLAEVEKDANVHAMLIRNNLPTTTTNVQYSLDDEDEDDLKAEVDQSMKRVKLSPSGRGRVGLTHSKGGVPLVKSRKNRKDYPSSWGCQPNTMNMKKRVMCAFDGSRRLWKDDMMLSNQYEVRVPLADGEHYITDLDVQTMRRAEAFHNATNEEKGPDFWRETSTQGIDLEALMSIKGEPSP